MAVSCSGSVWLGDLSVGQRRVLVCGTGAGRDALAAHDDPVGGRPGHGVARVRGRDRYEDRGKAIATLKSNGTLQALQKKYLQIYLSVPTIKP